MKSPHTHPSQTCSWETQILAQDCQSSECRAHHPYDDFHQDPTGHYVLIRVNFEYFRIELAVCDKEHKIIHIFYGRAAQDIYHAIFQWEQEKKVQWFTEKTHLAYLGKELKKAEVALSLGNSAYFQE